MTDYSDAEYQMIQDAAARFFVAESPVAAMRALRDAPGPRGFDETVWEACAQIGFTAVLVPREFGGLGLGIRAAAAIQQEIGRNLALLPFLSTSVLAASLIRDLGNENQKQRFLPAIVAGTCILAFAHDESSRHAPLEVTASACRVEGGFELNGEKTLVLDGATANQLIVSARIDDGTSASNHIGLFMVDPRDDGVTIEQAHLLDARSTGRLQLSSARVSSAAALESGNTIMAIARALDLGRVCLASELLGVAIESFDRTIEYIKQRDQFGVKIGSFQALQHRAAQLLCEIELCRSAVDSALDALHSDADHSSLLVAVAKGKASQVARLATGEAVQMHGGIGMTDEVDIGLFLKRARVAEQIFGDFAFQCDRVARSLGY